MDSVASTNFQRKSASFDGPNENVDCEMAASSPPLPSPQRRQTLGNHELSVNEVSNVFGQEEERPGLEKRGIGSAQALAERDAEIQPICASMYGQSAVPPRDSVEIELSLSGTTGGGDEKPGLPTLNLDTDGLSHSNDGAAFTGGEQPARTLGSNGEERHSNGWNDDGPASCPGKVDDGAPGLPTSIGDRRGFVSASPEKEVRQPSPGGDCGHRTGPPPFVDERRRSLADTVDVSEQETQEDHAESGPSERGDTAGNGSGRMAVSQPEHAEDGRSEESPSDKAGGQSLPSGASSCLADHHVSKGEIAKSPADKNNCSANSFPGDNERRQPSAGNQSVDKTGREAGQPMASVGLCPSLPSRESGNHEQSSPADAGVGSARIYEVNPRQSSHDPDDAAAGGSPTETRSGEGQQPTGTGHDGDRPDGSPTDGGRQEQNEDGSAGDGGEGNRGSGGKKKRKQRK